MASEWRAVDHWGAVKVRWGLGRMSYTVLPGLYAVGSPDATSHVLVSANYKLSFDHVRRAAAGLDAWILVLDTRGVNVWCAAGKGSFGTDELVRRIDEAELPRVVVHRRLIVPQLGAPGVAAHEVSRRTGFEVVWGPVEVDDLGSFVEAGLVATPEMRRRRFTVRDRLAVVPVELVQAGKAGLALAAIALVIGGLADVRGFGAGLLGSGLTGALVVMAAVVAGTIVAPVALPWVPGRAFAIKGALVALPMVALVLLLRVSAWDSLAARLEFGGWLLMGLAIAAFLAMNFTGASTFTSISGVRREMRFAVPAEMAAFVGGLALWLSSLWWVK